MVKFRYYEDEDDQDPRFTCTLKSERCSANKIGGSRCSNKVVNGLPKCYLHLLRDHNLRIAPSTIPNIGKGLFASTTVKIKQDVERSEEHLLFKNGEKIIEYLGEEIDDQENDRRYGTEKTAPYSLEVRQNKIIDGACERGSGSFVNHKNSAGSNCRFSKSKNGKVYIVATKRIYDGMELFVNYGRSYRLNDGSKHSTK